MPKTTDKKERLQKRNERIKKKFDHYTSIKHYSIDHALELLEDDFMPLSASTIWLIVSETGHYKNN